MTEAQAFIELIRQAPYIAALLVVVILFLRDRRSDRMDHLADRQEQREYEKDRDDAFRLVATECNIALKDANKALGAVAAQTQKMHSTAIRMEQAAASLELTRKSHAHVNQT